MSYKKGEILILEQIRSTIEFNEKNTSRGDGLIAGTGVSDIYTILRPGPFVNESQGMGGSYVARWVTIAELYAVYNKISNAHQRLQEGRQEIIDRFYRYRLAGDPTGTISDVRVSSGELPYNAKLGRVALLGQELVISWEEEVRVTLQE